MSSSKNKKNVKTLSKKGKQLKKLIHSDSESECSEHELSYYLNDRIKLMKEVLKIIKPKKIKNMAPDCMKKLDNEELNSILLEELLGISNKRLKRIFNGQPLEEDSSSSTDPEEEQQPLDIISLDDISDDDFVIDLDSDAPSENKRRNKHTSKTKVKEEPNKKKIKKEKHDKTTKNKITKKSKEAVEDRGGQENLMTVLELLELQARARAIKSQLALEHSKKVAETEKKSVNVEESDHDEAVIIESPKNIEIVITSESETDDNGKNNSQCHINDNAIVETDNERHTVDNNNEESREYSTQENEETLRKNLNFIENDSLINQTKETEKSSTNEKCENGMNVGKDESVESNCHPNCSDKPENEEENSAVANTDNEKKGCDKEPEVVDVKTGTVLEKEKKSHSTEKDIINNGTNSETIFINDSGSDSEKMKSSGGRKKHKKSKKVTTKESNISDSESDYDKVKTKHKRCRKHRSNTNRDPEVSGMSKNGKEPKIKSENRSDTKLNEIKNTKISIQSKSNNLDEGEGIVINMDQSEIDCIISD